ncbi:cupin domain-containing protein [Nonomuraea sp. NPDC050790]|uniref:cupin domain-containing protein n=1 Tax=Nonomuraea sp. NPDC050790 TaxID=3364371 RepID=UPI0037AC0F36
MTEVLLFGDDPSGYGEVPFASNLAVSFPTDTAGFLRFPADGHLRGWTLAYDETLYVIEGELTVIEGGRAVRVAAGSACFIGAGATVDYQASAGTRAFFVIRPQVNRQRPGDAPA